MNKALCFTVMRVLIVLMSCSLLNGCGSVYKSISGSDNSAFFPSVRFTHPLDEASFLSFLPGASETPVTKPAPAAVAHSAAFDLELVRTKGKASESLLPGEQVRLNDTTITGPASFEEDFSLSMVSLTFRNRLFVHPKIYLDFFGGPLYVERDLTLDSFARSKLSQMGLLIGLGAGWRITDRATLDFRWLPLAGTADGNIKVVDLTATYWLMDHAGVSAGYRRWHYEEEPAGSKIDLFWEGYSAGLVFSY